jgi:hypothetical protein
MAAIYSTTTQEGIDINSVFLVDTSFPEYPAPPFIPGQLAWGTDGSEFVYCTASVTISAGSLVLISSVMSSWSVAPTGGTVATAPTGQLLGVVGGSLGSAFVPAPAGTQKASYFWVQRAGNAPNVRTTATATKNVALFTSATTTGAVSSTGGGAGTTYGVTGLVISNNNGSTAGPNTAVLNYPIVGAGG